MPSDQTRGAIVAAAERLYADRGFGDVTLRDIVAEANVNLAAVNYHFGSKDELIAELFVTRSLALNRERLRELRAAEERGGGHADISDILRALVGPTLRGCLGPDNQRSTAARFMIRVSIESVPPIRRIRSREIDLAVTDAADRRHRLDADADHEPRCGRTLVVGTEAAAQGRSDQGAQNVGNVGMAAAPFLRGAQFAQALAIERKASRDEQFGDQLVLGAEMVVHGGKVDVGFSDDVAQRHIAKTAIGIKPLGGGNNGTSGLIAGHGSPPL